MLDMLGIDRLRLSSARPAGFLPRPSPFLLDRIQSHGLVDPIVVRPVADGEYEILSHPESWVAAGQLGLHKVPVRILDDLTESQAQAIVRDHYGAPNTDPITEAEQLALRLAQLGGEQSRGAITKLASLCGLRRTQVAHALRLLKLPSEIRHMVRTGKLKPGHARPLVTIPSRTDQIAAAQQIIDRRLSARAAEALAKRYRDQDRPPSTENHAPAIADPAPRSPDVERLERRVSELIGAGFKIEQGRAVIDFYGDFEILEGVLERVGYTAD